MVTTRTAGAADELIIAEQAMEAAAQLASVSRLHPSSSRAPADGKDDDVQDHRYGATYHDRAPRVRMACVELERANVNARALLPTCTCIAKLDKL